MMNLVVNIGDGNAFGFDNFTEKGVFDGQTSQLRQIAGGRIVVDRVDAVVIGKMGIFEIIFGGEKIHLGNKTIDAGGMVNGESVGGIVGRRDQQTGNKRTDSDFFAGFQVHDLAI